MCVCDTGHWFPTKNQKQPPIISATSARKTVSQVQARARQRARARALPLADSFLVLMILAAYSCPDDFFTHLRTTENAPLRREEKRVKKNLPGGP